MRHHKRAVALATAFILLLLLLLIGLHWGTESASAAPLHYLAPAASPTPLPTSKTAAPSAITLDPAIWAAIIGLAGALIASGLALYQFRRNTHLEKLKQADQFRHDEDMARLQKELEAQYSAKEKEEQEKTNKSEALRLKMLLDQTNTERAKTYRQALHADNRVSQLQILDMSQPLEVINVYVRVRVHQGARPGYQLDPVLKEAEARRDPNALFLASSRYLEQRTSNAIDPDEAILTYKHCVFVGDPGAGKTTLLKYLTLKSADNQLAQLPDLPIRIELNAFAASGYQDLLDFAAHEWEERYCFPKSDARAYMEENLKAGKALLLLDALDETVIGETSEAAEVSYERVLEIIMNATTRYAQSFIVVTARKAGYYQRPLLVGFTILEVLDFRREDIQSFITNWFNSFQNAQKQAEGEELIAKLDHNPRIQALAANPLLLSLIVLVYEKQLDLPERRAELYKRCVEILLTEWDSKRKIRRRREFKPEHKQQLLAEIAWTFHLQGKRYFPEREVLQAIAEFLPTVHLLPEQNG